MGRLNYRAMIMIAGVFTFLLVVLFAPADKAAYWNSLALGGLMVLFWIFEVLPIYVTALFPFVLAVPLGVLDSTLLAESYGHRLVFLFFGGFVLSLALENGMCTNRSLRPSSITWVHLKLAYYLAS